MGLPAVNFTDRDAGPWFGLVALWFEQRNPTPVGSLPTTDLKSARGLEPLADEVLFARVAGGDTEAFGVFYDRHEALLYSIALRILHVESEAEDVLQDAAVLIWERAPLYSSAQGKPLSWAVTVVRNKAIDRLRARRRRGELLERAAGEFEVRTGGSGEEVPDFCGESAGMVRNCLRLLPTEQRQAIELAFFGGLSQSEIAEELKEPLGTIKARIRRGMLAMRDALEGAL